MRYAAFFALVCSLSMLAADDAVKPPAPPESVAQAPETPRVNRQPQRKAPSEDDRAAVAEAAAKKRTIKKLEKEVAALEKELAASEAESELLKLPGNSNEARGRADRKVRADKKALKDKTKELEAAKVD